MDEFTTIIVLNQKLDVYKQALEGYRTMFEDMIVDPRINNALKGYYKDQVEKHEAELAKVEQLEKEIKEKGLYETQWGKEIINKANNISG